MNRLNMLIRPATTALALAIAACATQPDIDRDATFGAEFRTALAHPSAEMRVSALKTIQDNRRVSDSDSAMRLRGAILYQTATGQPKKFTAEATEILPALESARLHELPQELQALAYLAAKVGGKPELAGKLAAREIREAVDAGCSYPTPAAYATLSPEPARSFKKMFEFNMASACIAALNGRDAEALTKLVNAAAIVRATGLYADELVEAGVDSSSASATRFFLYRLGKQRGLNFNSYTR